MDRHPIGDLTEVTLSKIKEMVDVNTIVGAPIITPDGTTLIPVSKVTFGFGSGGSDMPYKDRGGFGGGNGAGVKIEPIGFLTISDGVVKMLNISAPANTTVDRLVELIPEIIDKAQQLIDKYKKD
ncbi:MAG: sporulation protein YtfJ [Firmicutes bacterium HGW-Firmicutes-16]|nr:MAG: sporulation protein YtfJ [Firmicutes bacterium HGW-Firmicutes-16]